MSASTRDWGGLGKAMRTQRLRLGLKQTSVAEAAGVTPRTLINYEKGRPLGDDEDVPGGYYRVEPIIRWAPGSVDAVLAGKEPTSLAEADANFDLDLTGLTAEALALYPQVAAFGQLCEAAGGNSDARMQFDEAATQLLQSMPGYTALGDRGLKRTDLGLAASRPHAQGEPVPLDDVVRAQVAAEAAKSNKGK